MPARVISDKRVTLLRSGPTLLQLISDIFELALHISEIGGANLTRLNTLLLTLQTIRTPTPTKRAKDLRPRLRSLRKKLAHIFESESNNNNQNKPLRGKLCNFIHVVAAPSTHQ